MEAEKMNKAIFEIGVEELPSSEYKNIIDQLKEKLEKIFKDNSLKYENMKTFISPRRFGALIEGFAEKQPDITEEKKGPPKNIAFDKEGNPTKAFQGFLKGAGLTEDDVKYKEINGAEYVVAEIFKPGKSTKEILETEIPKMLKEMTFKKSMKWGKGEFVFVRPVHWIMSKFNNEVLNIKAFGKEASNVSFGHRFFGGKITVETIDDYFTKMKENYVIVDLEERKQIIREQLEKIKLENKLDVEKDEALIEEIAELTEYPTAVIGEFKEKYMSLPQEIITVTVKHHQRSFVAKENGKVSNKYVSFQDGYGREKNVVDGYSRVINARLDDAAFYYEDDLETDLDKRLKELSGVTYHKGLGSYFDKIERMRDLSSYIGDKIGLKNLEKVRRASLLSKIDLTSNVVYEFPEMQGIMGRIYLEKKGEPEEIYMTASEHYRPFDETDDVPKSIESSIVSLSDKVDDIVGYFGIGKIPSGSKDPFALRRKAFGVIKILIENEWDLDLKAIINESSKILKLEYDEEKMEEFISSRLHTILSKSDINSEVINAVLINWNRPIRAFLSGKALNEFINDENFKQFITAFQRVNNISKNHNSTEYSGRNFKEEAEKDLFEKYLDVKPKFEKSIKTMNYKQAINDLIELKSSIDKYFDDVFVMDKHEDIRLNRLGFLKELANLFYEIGDVARLYQG
jgi:glycyl-tRNA synthetase beta chain